MNNINIESRITNRMKVRMVVPVYYYIYCADSSSQESCHPPGTLFNRSNRSIYKYKTLTINQLNATGGFGVVNQNQPHIFQVSPLVTSKWNQPIRQLADGSPIVNKFNFNYSKYISPSNYQYSSQSTGNIFYIGSCSPFGSLITLVSFIDSYANLTIKQTMSN